VGTRGRSCPPPKTGMAKSLKSMHSKGLALTRRMIKMGGRRCFSPWEVDPLPPEGSEHVWIVFEICCHINSNYSNKPSPAHSLPPADLRLIFSLPAPLGPSKYVRNPFKRQTHDAVWLSIWVPLGSLLATHVQVLWCPHRAKCGTKCVLRHHIKVNLHET